MQLSIKSLLLLVLLTSCLRAEETSFPLGFQPGNYVFSADTGQPMPPARASRFNLPEQSYNSCVPAGLVPGAYIASSYFMNSAEQLALKVVRVYVTNSYDTGPNSVELVEFIEGHLDRKGLAQWDGTTGLTEVSEEEGVSTAAEPVITGYEYVYNEGNSQYFVEVSGSEMTCNENLNRFEWHTIDPLLSYPSRGYLQLSYVDGRFMATGSVQRFYSFLGLTLGSYGSFTEFNFDIMPLVGSRVSRPKPQIE